MCLFVHSALFQLWKVIKFSWHGPKLKLSKWCICYSWCLGNMVTTEHYLCSLGFISSLFTTLQRWKGGSFGLWVFDRILRDKLHFFFNYSQQNLTSSKWDFPFSTADLTLSTCSCSRSLAPHAKYCCVSFISYCRKKIKGSLGKRLPTLRAQNDMFTHSETSVTSPEA